jgi:hypothetical protein
MVGSAIAPHRKQQRRIVGLPAKAGVTGFGDCSAPKAADGVRSNLLKKLGNPLTLLRITKPCQTWNFEEARVKSSNNKVGRMFRF